MKPVLAVDEMFPEGACMDEMTEVRISDEVQRITTVFNIDCALCVGGRVFRTIDGLGSQRKGRAC